MGIVGTVGKFAGGLNWIRIGLIAVIAVMLFGAGYQYSNTKHAKKEAENAKATANEIARLSREHTEKLRALALVAAGKEITLNKDLDEIAIHRDALLEQIKTAEMTKPVSEVRIESCVAGDDENVQIVVANPFSDSFRVVWNQAARNLRPSGSTGTDPD